MNDASGGKLPLCLADARTLLNAVTVYGAACVSAGASDPGASERVYSTFLEIVRLVHGAYESSPQAQQDFAEIEAALMGDAA